MKIDFSKLLKRCRRSSRSFGWCSGARTRERGGAAHEPVCRVLCTSPACCLLPRVLLYRFPSRVVFHSGRTPNGLAFKRQLVSLRCSYDLFAGDGTRDRCWLWHPISRERRAIFRRHFTDGCEGYLSRCIACANLAPYSTYPRSSFVPDVHVPRPVVVCADAVRLPLTVASPCISPLLHCSPPRSIPCPPPLVGYVQKQHLLVRLVGQHLSPLRSGLHARAARQRHLSHLRLHQQVRSLYLPTRAVFVCHLRRDLRSISVTRVPLT